LKMSDAPGRRAFARVLENQEMSTGV